MVSCSNCLTCFSALKLEGASPQYIKINLQQVATNYEVRKDHDEENEDAAIVKDELNLAVVFHSNGWKTSIATGSWRVLAVDRPPHVPSPYAQTKQDDALRQVAAASQSVQLLYQRFKSKPKPAFTRLDTKGHEAILGRYCCRSTAVGFNSPFQEDFVSIGEFSSSYDLHT